MELELLTLAMRPRRSAEQDARLVSAARALGAGACRALARANQCLPLVADALAEVLPADEAARWSRLADRNGDRVERLLDAAAAVMDRAGVPHAAIEAGGVLAATELPARAYCSGDLDLIVAPPDLRAVERALEAEGFDVAERDGRVHTERIECRRVDPDGTELWLEVATRPFTRTFAPLALEDRLACWLSRARPSVCRPALQVLAPADLLCQVAVHTSLHSWVRAPGLRLHVDTARVVADTELSWDAVLDEVGRLGGAVRVWLSLVLARDLLGAEVPQRVLEALAPGRVRQRSARALLDRQGLLADGRPKLPRAEAIALDVLVSDERPWGWARGVLWPERAWLSERYGAAPTWRLHARRWRAVAGRWRPR